MSKMSNAVKANRNDETTKRVTNFMGGDSFEINPMDTLKMVTASSIFGEPQYYRDGEFADAKIKDGKFGIDKLVVEYSVLELDKYKGMKTSQLMEKVIDDALNYDFKATIDWALTLRRDFLMRLNPQVIMVRAALNENRKAFNEKNPNYFSELNAKVMQRADDVISQVTYILYINGSKSKIPSVLKRSWAKRVASFSRYELYKYRNHGIGLIDTIRICHANGQDINELMQTGTIEVASSEKTWESLRASNMEWAEILNQINMPHMALLRNLRGIFKEIDQYAECEKILEKLKNGVKKGKQFPFRYMSASKAVTSAKDVNFKENIKDALEECLDISCENLPRLKGKSAFLSDNSGSAWGTCTSEYGTVTVAEIDNLSCVIGAANSDEGYVFPFGDRLEKFAISKRQGILEQAKKMGKTNVGGGTENGVWLFFDKAITEKEHWDNIFIYSDMQAGHGGLYGTASSKKKYCELGYGCNRDYINVMKLIETYRKEVNPKVNVYCVQTAGYDNVLVPEYAYRCNILYGWTGKELVFADAMNKFWDEKDAQQGE